jgi:hypothetical protein
MKKLFYLLITFSLFSCTSSEQTKTIEDDQLTALLEFHTSNTSCFKSKKVETLMAKQFDKDTIPEFMFGDDFIKPLNDQQIKDFSVEEWLFYSLSYPQSYSQNCGYPVFDSNGHQKIFKEIPSTIEGLEMSEQQFEALSVRRAKVIPLLIKCINNSDFIDLEMRRLISDLKAIECIPALIKLYNRQEKKDHDILTLFIGSMEENEFPPYRQFERSIIFKKGDNQRLYIDASTQNINAILKLAKDFSK